MHICLSYYFLTSINRWYHTDQEGYGGCFYSTANLFQYSLPLFLFLQMMVAMVLFVQFKWKWGVRIVSLQQTFTDILAIYNAFRT